MERLIAIPVTSPRFSLALLLLRFVVGASFLFHGNPKLAHPSSWANGYPLLPGIPSWLQLLVTVSENLGGLCILFGFLTPIFAFLQTCEMIVVIFIAKWAHNVPFYAARGGNFELETHLLVGSVIFLLCGAGLYSIDALFSRRRSAFVK
jgi:uncharacterized membrane protein YphA (DoxX/SURF4 family)